MRNALLISLIFHVAVLSAVPLSILLQRKPSYPVDVYQVSISALPGSAPTSVVEPSNGGPAVTTEKKRAKAKETVSKEKSKGGVQSSLPGKGGKAGVSAEGNFQYNYYLDLVLNKIGENWRNPYEGEGGKVSATVYFVIKKDGTLDKIKIEKSSNNYYFDQAALGAVYATRKLPPLPTEFKQEWLGVHYEFEYMQ